METANLTIGHEFLESFCSCIGRKNLEQFIHLLNYSMLFYKGIVENEAIFCYNLGVAQKTRATLTCRNIKCYRFRINYIIIQQNTKIPGYLNGNSTLPNKIIIIYTTISSALLAIIFNYPHLCVWINVIKNINFSVV